MALRTPSFGRTLAFGTAALAALAFSGAASADDHRRDGWNRGHHDGGYRHGGYDHRRGHHGRRHDDDGDDAALLIGGAILGLVVGAALADDGPDRAPTYTYADPSYGYGYEPAPSYGYAPQAAPRASYASSPCSNVRGGRTATGAVVGGLVGGLLGNGVAASKNREEGTAVGAVVGSVIGGSIGNSSTQCNDAYAQPAGYYQTSGYVYEPQVYGGAGASAPSYGSSYGQDYGQGYGQSDELLGAPGGSESTYNGPAAEECERSWRVTTFPDGREVREPVYICREAYYGDWEVRE